ncbi:hypothetical protein FRC16_009728 [Serendipita sp. 398]|nr:hypothetical protein FRC16_009728 [Serendipita sp. 398]
MRPRTSSIPSLADAEYAFHSARKQPLRRILAYTVLTTFLAVFLILGFAGSYPKDWASLELGGFRGFPDFEHIRGDGVRTITAEQLKESRRKRYVVVGDIHGMHQSFEKLMSTVSYSESSDYLIHVGDLVAKGPSSAKVVHDLSHQNVTGVRGNHDQKVIEWKGWIDWVESYNGGSEWLKDMESKTESELEELKKNTKKRKWKIPEGDDGKKRNMTWWESLVEDGGEIIDWDPEEEEEPDYTWSRIPKKLPCNPSTVIYGHAAGRGLDLKRWTLGLDSGCVYGRRMTALVFSEDEKELATLDALGVSSPGTPSNTDSEPEVQVTKIDLGDTLDNGKHLHARLASVRCPDVGA